MRAYFKINPLPLFFWYFLALLHAPTDTSSSVVCITLPKIKIIAVDMLRMYIHVLSRIRRAGNSLLAISSCTIILGLPFAVLATGPDKMDGVISISTTTGPGAIYHT